MDRSLAAFAIGVSTVIVTAQAPRPTFEVASVKRRVETLIVDMAVRRLGVPVLDRTGVDGMFDFVMFMSPDESRSPGLDPSSQSAPSDPGLPSFSTALREQLGLRLEAARGPVDVLVIDSVQRPTKN